MDKFNNILTKANISRESLEILVDTHFPGNNRTGIETPSATSRYEDGMEEIISREQLLWAINTFDSYKSPEQDGIIPKILQVIGEDSLSWLTDIFKTCTMMNYVPRAWREAKVIIKPKLGRRGHVLAKD